MKITIILLITTIILSADYVEVKQNMRALYKDVNLTETQKNYIENNQDENIEIINKLLQKETEKLKKKNYIHEKNIIEFILNQDMTISTIKFIKKSNDRSIDNITKEIIEQARNKFNKPIEPTPMRFIFIYEIGEVTDNENINSNTTANKNSYEKSISRGTTRFEHTSEEYIRIFETKKDGFINLSVNPALCMNRATILTEYGQNVKMVGIYNMSINQEVTKGKYKILFKTEKTCNVNLQYP